MTQPEATKLTWRLRSKFLKVMSQGCDCSRDVVEVPLASAAIDSALADATNADMI